MDLCRVITSYTSCTSDRPEGQGKRSFNLGINQIKSLVIKAKEIHSQTRGLSNLEMIEACW